MFLVIFNCFSTYINKPHVCVFYLFTIHMYIYMLPLTLEKRYV